MHSSVILPHPIYLSNHPIIHPSISDTQCVYIDILPSWELTYPLSKGILKIIFLFPRWDMLVSWRVPTLAQNLSLSPTPLGLVTLSWDSAPMLDPHIEYFHRSNAERLNNDTWWRRILEGEGESVPFWGQYMGNVCHSRRFWWFLVEHFIQKNTESWARIMNLFFKKETRIDTYCGWVLVDSNPSQRWFWHFWKGLKRLRVLTDLL